MSETEDFRYKPLPEDQYPAMLAHINDGRVTGFVLTALLELDPAFAAWLDANKPPPPEAAAGTLAVPEDQPDEHPVRRYLNTGE